MKLSRETLRILARDCRDIQALVALNDHALLRNHGQHAVAVVRAGKITVSTIR